MQLSLPKHLSLHMFENREELVKALTKEISHQLDRANQIRGKASIAVSGGRTPKNLFSNLSQTEVDWTRTTLTLVDERWVATDNRRSNERLVRDNLLVGRAAFASFVPFYRDDLSAADAEASVEQSFSQIPLPLDVVVFGMGIDGHTASWFGDGDNFEAATDLQSARNVISMRSASAEEPRMTLTLQTLIAARYRALHIEGEEKLATLARALQDGDADQMPVRHILQQSKIETGIFWAP